MEIDVTKLVREADCFEFSASRAERGNNAGKETWANAKTEANESPLLKSAEDLDAARSYFAEFGAWSREELAAMSDAEINALLIQFIAGDVREAQEIAPSDNEDGIDWKAYEKMAEDGRISGSLFPFDGRVFASISH